MNEHTNKCPFLLSTNMNSASFPTGHDLLDRLFSEARSYKHFTNQPIETDRLKAIYNLARLGPTASNTCPQRILFVQSKEAKEQLIPTLAPGNIEKTKSAPVTAILAYDLEFYTYLPRLAPHMSQPSSFEKMPEQKLKPFLLRNASLQAAFFIMAARSLGVDCGPMSGFNQDAVDQAFFANSTWRSNFLVNLGIGTNEGLHDRGERLAWDEACRVL